MTLVERFIEIINWPASRKIVLVTALILPGHFTIWLLVHFGETRAGVVDSTMLEWLWGAWTAGVALAFLAGLYAVLTGREGRWTAYLFIVLYATPVVALIYLFGTASTVYMALFPLSVLGGTLLFDERVGWFYLLYGLVLIVLVGYLESQGILPYAPILLERSIDAQRNNTWFALHYSIIFTTFIASFLLGILILSARRLQEARLRETHMALEKSAGLLEQSNRLIRRYIPAQLADKILEGGHGEEAKHERRNLTIFFSDVEGFTNASDELDPEKLAGLLNEYLSEMAMIAEHFGATINQFVGDGVMIFFGAPTATNDKDHALRAVRMSLDMQKRMQELQGVWFKRGFQRPFRIRIGINTGYASVGDFGSQGRMVYSAIGLQTNLSARIQAQCEPGKVLISHSTWALVHDEIGCVSKDEIQVKGIHYPVKVYEVVNKS